MALLVAYPGCTLITDFSPGVPALDAADTQSTRNDGGLSNDAENPAYGSCLPSEGCLEGPRCGTTCCAAGEWCDTASSGGPSCRCGSNAACRTHQTCTPSSGVATQCGDLCCSP